MSVSRGLKRVAADSATSRLQWLRANAAGYFCAAWTPAQIYGRGPPGAARFGSALVLLLVIVIVAATMTMIDAPSVGVAQRVPEWLIGSLR